MSAHARNSQRRINVALPHRDDPIRCHHFSMSVYVLQDRCCVHHTRMRYTQRPAVVVDAAEPGEVHPAMPDETAREVRRLLARAPAPDFLDKRYQVRVQPRATSPGSRRGHRRRAASSSPTTKLGRCGAKAAVTPGGHRQPWGCRIRLTISRTWRSAFAGARSIGSRFNHDNGALRHAEARAVAGSSSQA